jgi:hypothetical protein
VIAFAAILRSGSAANLFAGDQRMVGFWRKPSNSIVAVMSATAQSGLRQPNEEQFQGAAAGGDERIQSAASRRIVFTTMAINPPSGAAPSLRRVSISFRRRRFPLMPAL